MLFNIGHMQDEWSIYVYNIALTLSSAKSTKDTMPLLCAKNSHLATPQGTLYTA